MYAFRCKNCGKLETPDNAGENLVPHACTVCGSGVVHSPTVLRLSQELAKPDTTDDRRKGIAAELQASARTQEMKEWHPDNWEVLADASSPRLAELGLTPDRVVRYKPEKVTEPRFVKMAVASVSDALGGSEVAGAK